MCTRGSGENHTLWFTMWQKWFKPITVWGTRHFNLCFYPSSSVFSLSLSFFIPFRNQAMRKKLILYFKRRNHARKQWVSRVLHILDPLLRLSPWLMISVKLGQLLLEVRGHSKSTEEDKRSFVSTVPRGSFCFWRTTKSSLSHCLLKENPR